MKTVARVLVRLTSLRLLQLADCRRLASLTILLGLVLVNLGMGQQAPADPQAGNAFCTFDDGKQISARYSPVSAGHNDGPPTGKIWMPGGSALTLFTDTDVTISNSSIPTGAYTMYLMPGKKNWTLIVSKNVKVDGKYDEKKDLARASMEVGTLGDAEEQLKLFFGHLGPKLCELNIDYGKTRAWVQFKQK